ncbi:MAG: NAD(P)/FAD-dependent oxidoreductase [Anaerolineaceae bacterium]|nr:NAD(P)/FAD-dependent oxidoreductase [Anaerolineaceae bacterium]
MVDKENKVVIVGAGMAGLTAAAYLTRENYKVLLLDKNERVGGLVGTFESNGFFFDSGPRAFVNSGILKPILKDLGIQWDFIENKISIGVEDQLFRINSMEDLQEYKRVLEYFYPEDKEEINNIIAIISELSGYTKVLYEFDNPNFIDLKNNKKFIFKKLIPWTFKFLLTLRKLNQYNIPMEEFIKNKISNQSMIDIILQHFFRKTPTHFALGYFYVYLDYFYPKSGTGALCNLLEEKILEGGGDIKLNTEIKEIIPSRSTIVDSEGNDYQYDHLIWAADLKKMYRIQNLEGLEATTTTEIAKMSDRMLAAKGAESVYILYIAVNRPISYFKQHGGEHLFYTPSSQGLGETNQNERLELLENFDKKSKQEIFDWLNKFIRLNTYEISIPALRDSSLAPEGQSGLMVSCLLDYQIIKNVEKAGWYQEFKETLEFRVIDILSETIYKNLNEDVLFKFSSTPLTIEKISGSSEGAIVGWSFETPVPVINKLEEIPKSVLTPIENIYQAGQWSYSPAGVPIAMLTGWYATQKIFKQKKQK